MIIALKTMATLMTAADLQQFLCALNWMPNEESDQGVGMARKWAATE